MTIIDRLIELIPIVAGALIALAGASLKYWVDRSDQRKQIKREKLERILQLAHQLKGWTDEVDDRFVFRKHGNSVTSPAEEMRVLGLLYFPELKVKVLAVSLAATTYQNTALKVGHERFNAIGSTSSEQTERIKECYESLLDALEDLTKAAEKHASELL